jgi:WD40 repeat protein
MHPPCDCMHPGCSGTCTQVMGLDGAWRVASGAEDATVRLWDPVRGGGALMTLQGHTLPVLSLACDALAAGGVRITSGGEDNKLRIWRPDAEALRAIEPDEPAAPAGLSGRAAMHRLACAGCTAQLGWVDVRGTALYALCDRCHKAAEQGTSYGHGHGHAHAEEHVHGPCTESCTHAEDGHEHGHGHR